MHEDDLSDLAQVWAEYAKPRRALGPYQPSPYDSLREAVCMKAYDFVAAATQCQSSMSFAELKEALMDSLQAHADLYTLLAGVPISMSFLTDADVESAADQVQRLRNDINGRIARIFGLNKE